jgi:hypothetical protein
MGQVRSAEDCYDDKDQTCLEALFADIVTNPSPEKNQAIYLLGLLQKDTGDFDGALDSFMMSVAFGGNVDGQQALHDLFANEPTVFDEASECSVIENEACFIRIIKEEQGDDVRNAQYLLGSMLLSSEPDRGVALLESANAAGHGTAACVLQEFYLGGPTGGELDYDKSVSIGFDCPFSHPFPRLNESHFAKYEGQDGHKAYALSEDGFASYSEGASNSDVAARLAKEYCEASPKRAADAPECNVINVDGVWVDDPELIELPIFNGDVESLVTLSAQTAFSEKYEAAEGLKVFVYSRNGSWEWLSSTKPDSTIEKLTEDALGKCGGGWRNMLEYACEVISINGETIE